MITAKNYEGKTVGVLGLGKTGIAAVKSFLSGGAKVIAWDDRNNLLNDRLFDMAIANERLRFGVPVEKDWKEMSILVASPGIPLKYPHQHYAYANSMKYGVQLLSDLELLQKFQPNSSYVGITGTNGKSTTTSLVSHIFKTSGKIVEECGNIGRAVLESEPLDNSSEYYIIEASSFQLDLLDKMRFNIAVCLSITPDHLDRHGTFEEYIKAKSKIFFSQTKDDFAIVSVNNPNSQKLLEHLSSEKQKLIKVSSTQRLADGISVVDNILYDNCFSKESYRLENLENLSGEHNAENIAAAFAVAVAARLPVIQIINSLRSFKALPHRMQLVHRSGSLSFINDSKATNVDSAYWALKTFDNIYWIAGGRSKSDDLSKLAPFFSKIKQAYLVGEAAALFSSVLSGYGVKNTVTGTVEETVRLIKSGGVKEGNILLSPACSSLDQWKNFEERGEFFTKLVKEIW